MSSRPYTQNPAPRTLVPEEMQRIIQTEDPKLLVEKAEALAHVLVDLKLATSQIRNVFSSVRLIEMTWREDAAADVTARAWRELLLLQPRLAYQAAKEGDGVKALAGVLQPCIGYVAGKRENFGRFVDFFEAIIAYHRAFGGRESNRAR